MSEDGTTVTSLEQLRVVIMRRVSLVMAVAASVITAGMVVAKAPLFNTGIVVCGVISTLVAHGLARQERGFESVAVIVFGITAMAFAYLCTINSQGLANTGVQILFIVTLLSAFLSTPRSNQIFLVLGVVTLAVSPVVRSMRGISLEMAGPIAVTDVAHFTLLWFGAAFLSRTLRRTQNALTSRLEEIGDVVDRAREVAHGNLEAYEAEDDDGARAVMSQMVDGLREIVVEVNDGVTILRSSAASLATMTEQHEQGATNQASAVFETQETIESLATSAERIASTSSDVLSNAESTLKSSESATENMRQLGGFVGSINELLEAIKEVANKSEMLALNASLEGVKAGEAGRGFLLVANEMQRLAENTSAMVGRVKALTDNIDEASQKTLSAISDTTRLAGDTTRAAREISMTTRQQGSGAHQVVEAMRDISAVTSEFASTSKASSSAVSELDSLAARLQERMQRFSL